MTNLLLSYKKAIDVNIITSITNSNGTIVYVNEKFCEVSKYHEHELLGQSHSIISSGHHPPEFFGDLWKTIKKGELWQGEIKNRAKDGSYYWVDTVILPIPNNNETQYLSLRMIITEKKELEARQQEYVKTLENIVYMISHYLRKPVVTILGLLQLDVSKMSEQDKVKWEEYLKVSAKDLDFFTKDLTDFIRKTQKKIE
jgi:PAS domain S-box-containing protein